MRIRIEMANCKLVNCYAECPQHFNGIFWVFWQPGAKRSKTVIIVKNLQHGTKLEDLENLFSPFGHLGKVVLPPSRVTALVELEKLSSAAKAFEKIAYTKVR